MPAAGRGIFYPANELQGALFYKTGNKTAIPERLFTAIYY